MRINTQQYNIKDGKEKVPFKYYFNNNIIWVLRRLTTRNQKRQENPTTRAHIVRHRDLNDYIHAVVIIIICSILCTTPCHSHKYILSWHSSVGTRWHFKYCTKSQSHSLLFSLSFSPDSRKYNIAIIICALFTISAKPCWCALRFSYYVFIIPLFFSYNTIQNEPGSLLFFALLKYICSVFYFYCPLSPLLMPQYRCSPLGLLIYINVHSIPYIRIYAFWMIIPHFQLTPTLTCLIII